ncbi:hypothetical protein STSO111631_09620 [Stackebrandtia soli]
MSRVADAQLATFAEKGRYTSFPKVDAVLNFGDMELLFTVVERAGRFELGKSDRGSRPRLLIASDDLDVVRRFLVAVLGDGVRAQARLPRLVLRSPTDPMRAGFSLTEVDAELVLSWSDNGRRSARFPNSLGGKSEALRFAMIADRSEEAIMRLYDPSWPVTELLTESALAGLAEIGKACLAPYSDEATLRVVELPDRLGVCVLHTVRGGGKVYVAPDGSALFASSAMDFDAGLSVFRSGQRTPPEKLGPGR